MLLPGEIYYPKVSSQSFPLFPMFQFYPNIRLCQKTNFLPYGRNRFNWSTPKCNSDNTVCKIASQYLVKFITNTSRLSSFNTTLKTIYKINLNSSLSLNTQNNIEMTDIHIIIAFIEPHSFHNASHSHFQLWNRLYYIVTTEPC